MSTLTSHIEAHKPKAKKQAKVYGAARLEKVVANRLKKAAVKSGVSVSTVVATLLDLYDTE